MPLGVSQAGEEEIAAGCLVTLGGQQVPSGQVIRVRLRQSPALVAEDLQGEAGVELWIIFEKGRLVGRRLAR